MRPSKVTAQIEPPFAAHSDDRKVAFKIAWANLRVILDGLPKGLWQVAINGDDFALRGAVDGIGPITGKVDHATADAAERPNQTDRDYDFRFALSAATLPLLDRVLGANSSADIGAQGTLTKADLDPALTMPENLDRWRAAGGMLEMVDATLTSGETKFEAHGALTLDQAHQVQGKFDTESFGLEPLLRRLGVDPMLVSAGSLLSSIIGGTPGQEDSLRVPVSFNGGRLYIGPVRTSIRVAPLY